MILLGDCRERMAAMEAASVDAIVTDPPYGLRFMGREWDHGVPGVPFWTEALRVLKPGGHLLAFGGTRTFHRLAVAIEDAGFEIRDCLSWLYGSGFPKSLDVSKAIDKAAGCERPQIMVPTQPKNTGRGGAIALGATGMRDISEPVSDAARAWSGFGTALKPAWEPIILARKPLSGTVAATVLAHGTGAINIDKCRIGTEENLNGGAYAKDGARSILPGDTREGAALGMLAPGKTAARDFSQPSGRWPANVCLDEEAAAALDEQSGTSAPKPGRVGIKGGNAGALGAFAGSTADAVGTWPADPGGGASRFFYTAKSSRSDREAGNVHPTVKPTDLMRWLCRLVTPPNGLILDPFAGSGSTGVAAVAEGFRFIGIEQDAEYVAIAERRIANVAPLFQEMNP